MAPDRLPPFSRRFLMTQSAAVAVAASLFTGASPARDVSAGGDPSPREEVAEATACGQGASLGQLSLASGGIGNAPQHVGSAEDALDSTDPLAQQDDPVAARAASASGFFLLAGDSASLASCSIVAAHAGATPDAAGDDGAAEVAPKPAPKPRRPAKPPADTLKAWWPEAQGGKLNLRFAGEAAFGQALALLFDAPAPDAGALAQHIRVRDSAGRTVESKWQVVKSNPQMVALKVDPGIYTVKLEAGLTSTNGLRFDRTAEGKIFVR